MLIDFNTMRKITAPRMNNGIGSMTAKMHVDEQGKIIPCTIHPGGSIGLHQHKTSDDINYILSGTGKAMFKTNKSTAYEITSHSKIYKYLRKPT